MAEWSVKPEWKKSIIERQHMTKDGNEIIIETGWRWGEFIVYTDDDNPPNIEAGVDIYNCDYETELVETSDGCWEEHDFDDCDDETREWLEEFFDEGNSYFDLEEHGWIFSDCEMIIDCDLEIRKINEDGSLDDPIEVEVDEEEAAKLQAFVDEHNASVKLKSQAQWPFGPELASTVETAKWPFERPHEGPKKELEMTDWFPVEINPVREGFYEIKTLESINFPYPNKAKWDGKKFEFLDHTITHWRGLAKDPGAK